MVYHHAKTNLDTEWGWFIETRFLCNGVKELFIPSHHSRACRHYRFWEAWKIPRNPVWAIIWNAKYHIKCQISRHHGSCGECFRSGNSMLTDVVVLLHLLRTVTSKEICTQFVLVVSCCGCSWWRHQMETFSALLVLCAGNTPVTSEFPSQRPVTWSFVVLFDLHLIKWLNKQSWGLVIRDAIVCTVMYRQILSACFRVTKWHRYCDNHGNDCPNTNEITLNNMGKSIPWSHKNWLNKHNQFVCMFIRRFEKKCRLVNLMVWSHAHILSKYNTLYLIWFITQWFML